MGPWSRVSAFDPLQVAAFFTTASVKNSMRNAFLRVRKLMVHRYHEFVMKKRCSLHAFDSSYLHMGIPKVLGSKPNMDFWLLGYLA